MTPIVDGIKREYRGRLNVVYLDITRTRGEEMAREYNIMGTPTLLLLDSEGNQVNVLRGWLSKSALERAVDDLLAQSG